MTVNQLLQVLEKSAESSLHIMLPTGEFVPDHFHVTEVGRVQKRFVDCGGTRREMVSCVIQVWTANDTHHRLPAGKLATIFQAARPVLETEELPVELEYGADVAALYHLANVEITPRGLLFVLAGKQTECLAPDRCGVGECGPAGSC